MLKTSPSTEIFSRVIEPEQGNFSPDLARFVIDLDFKDKDHDRYEELSIKAQAGSLLPQETEELDSYLHVDSLLAVMRLKAERSIKTK